ncbi:MAG: hypothetical protein IPP72_17840 [Chitinophagaceae bacterium]|nr:hypothetical protein [Chitinophagaceae bacterium]
MRNTILIAVISLAIISCTKNKFETTPKLKYESVNTTQLSSGQIIQFKLSYTDAEGDLQDSIYVEKYGINCELSRFKAYYLMPEFPVVKNSEGDIIVSYGYGVSNYPLIQSPQCSGKNDTCYFLFMIQDKAKHKSDTVASETIIIYQ